RLERRDGSELFVEALGTNLLDTPEVQAVVVTLRDVSERRAFEEQLRHRAFHDPLTQLPNRALLCDRIEHALARELRSSLSVAITPGAGVTADELLRNADLAMYAAKHNGKGCFEVFDPALQATVLEGLGPAEADGDEPDRATWFMRKEEQRREIEALLADEHSI